MNSLQAACCPAWQAARRAAQHYYVAAPDWFVGDNTRQWVLITSPGNPGPAHSRESVEQAVSERAWMFLS